MENWWQERGKLTIDAVLLHKIEDGLENDQYNGNYVLDIGRESSAKHTFCQKYICDYKHQRQQALLLAAVDALL